MRVADVMTKGVQTAPSTMPAFEAWELMRRKGIRHLVVLDDGDVAGVLSERDAGGRRGANLRADATIGDLMTVHPVTIAPDATIRRAASVMRGRTIGCLPVVDGKKKLAGIVTVSDLLELLGRGIDRPAQPDRRGLHHRVAHRKMHGGGHAW